MKQSIQGLKGRSAHHYQKGTTLTEVIAGVAVSALVLIGATKLYAAATSSADATDSYAEIIGVRQGVRSLNGTQGNYTGITMATLRDAMQVPSSLACAAGAITTCATSFNGTLGISAAALSSFTIQAVAVPKDLCIKIATSMDGSWTGGKIGATTVTYPMAPATAATNCAAATQTMEFSST